jgi:hypothetical protein
MQNVGHKGLYVKCDNMSFLGTIDFTHIYLGNLDFEGYFYTLEILFTMIVKL